MINIIDLFLKSEKDVLILNDGDVFKLIFANFQVCCASW